MAPPIGSPRRRVQAGLLPAGACIALAALLLAAPARAADPLRAMRNFLQADGRGDRLDPRRWPAVEGLVAWPLEPAWDHLSLILGFELGAPLKKDGSVEIEVKFTVLGDVRSSGHTTEARLESRVYRLDQDENGEWRIRAPAPPPYIFASEVDAEALVALLSPDDSTYVSDSAFAWRLLRGAGWLIAYANVDQLAASSDYTTERTAEIGDLVLYYDGDRPYHVGIVESDDTVVSSTLNGGIRRTPFGAFAGEIRYRRPVAVVMETATPDPNATPTPRPKRAGKPKK